jgi:U3 small nucleolar ribonucleoprotein component
LKQRKKKKEKEKRKRKRSGEKHEMAQSRAERGRLVCSMDKFNLKIIPPNADARHALPTLLL